MPNVLSDEVSKVLDETKLAEIALELEPYIYALRRRIVSGFWENVRNVLNGRLEKDRRFDRWATGTELEAGTDYKALILGPKNCLPNAAYCVGVYVEHHGSFLAVQRPCAAGRTLSNEDSLRKILGDRGYTKADSYFSGWRYTVKLGLMDFASEDNANLKRQLHDNSDASHPEAKKVAAAIFELFDACLNELEPLNFDLA